MLKTLLESLLSLFVKKAEGTWAVNKTRPASISSDQTVVISEGYQCSVMAPIDGWVSVSSSGIENNRFRALVSLKDDGGSTLLSATTISGASGVGLSLPIKKGTYIVIQYMNGASIDFRFTECAGGSE